MPQPDDRASDADRDQVAALLREAHAQGRLDVDELGERLDATYTAKTYGQLATLTQDLPMAPLPAPRPPASPAPQPATPAAHMDPRLKGAWTAWAVAVAVNVVIWGLVSASNGDAAYFWPMWVAGPWGAVLLVTTVAGLGRRR